MNSQQSTVRMVIGVLGSLALAVVVGGIYLTAQGHSLPGELIAIGSAAAGAVGGILSKTGSDPTPVVGVHGGPVAVEDVGERGASDVAVIVVGVLAVILVLVLVGRI